MMRVDSGVSCFFLLILYSIFHIPICPLSYIPCGTRTCRASHDTGHPVSLRSVVAMALCGDAHHPHNDPFRRCVVYPGGGDYASASASSPPSAYSCTSDITSETSTSTNSANDPSNGSFNDLSASKTYDVSDRFHVTRGGATCFSQDEAAEAFDYLARTRFVERVKERMLRTKFHFPQMEADADASFCNESVYGKFTFLEVTGLVRLPHTRDDPLGFADNSMDTDSESEVKKRRLM